MPLQAVDISFNEQPLPSDLQAFVNLATERIERFETIEAPVDGFVPSDFSLAYRVIEAVVRERQATGDLFCEWGCGFGVVAALAASLGLNAYGIEVDNGLIREAYRLQDDSGHNARLIEGSILPPRHHSESHDLDSLTWLRSDAESAYPELGLDIEDFNIIYAYPWPGEEGVIEDLFWRYATPGALLITYLGAGAIKVQRSVRKRRG